jgi:excisionase family DNA binding protein
MSIENGDRCSVSKSVVSITSREPVPRVSPNGSENQDRLLTADEIAEKMAVPASWVRAHTRARTLDPLPVVRLGRYTRFRWSAVEAWLKEHEASSEFRSSEERG